MTSPSPPSTATSGAYDAATYDAGIITFSLLFTRWMDENGWSHPVMTSLAKHALNGTSWLHSSQISGIRHRTLTSPGPRTFVAIASLNKAVHNYRETKALIPGTRSSNHYSNAFAILEDGVPPSVGWWVEVFCGARRPKDIDVYAHHLTERQAVTLSIEWVRFFRRRIAEEQYDLIEDLPRLIRDHYPAGDTARIEALTAVVHGRHLWTPTEWLNELSAVVALTSAIGGPVTEEELLKTLLNHT